jgi:hypothetical protein
LICSQGSRATSSGCVGSIHAGWLLVGTVGAEPATAAPSGMVIFGSKCPDVMVIAARRSGQSPQPATLGEPPQPDWADPAAYRDLSTSFDAGKENADLFQRPKIPFRSCNFSLDPVQYAAIEAGYIVDTRRK